MKQAWVNKKERMRKEKISKLTSEIRSKLLDFGPYSKEEVEIFMDEAMKCAKYGFYEPKHMLPIGNEAIMKRLKSDLSLWKKTYALLDSLPYKDLAIAVNTDYEIYLDSDEKHFHGDIIITDPCYVIKDDDWGDVVSGKPVTAELPSTMIRDTLYGDWSCTTLNTLTKEPIGNFCADAGMVAVFVLAEVRRYDPDFDYERRVKNGAATLIKAFDGTCQFVVKHTTSKYVEFSVRVVGKGMNFVTNEPIEFRTFQSGF